MSRFGQNGQVPLFDDAALIESVLSTERVRAQRRHEVRPHAHTAHELLWGFDGPRTIEADGATWSLPPTVGLWIPAGCAHAGVVAAGSSYSCTFIHPQRASVDWPRATAVAITTLLRELLLHLHSATFATREQRMLTERVALGLLEPVATSTLPLTMPDDDRARLVADAILADPSDRQTLDAWGRHVGAASRTLQRLFVRDTGMGFAAWRTHARVRAAIPLLAQGHSVADVGHRVGYRTASAFVRAFRGATGQPPGAYLATQPCSTNRRSPDAGAFDTIMS